jgi:hypothetical protein
VLEEYLEVLVDLSAEGVRVLNQVQQIGVVPLEQHASELAGLLWVDVLQPIRHVWHETTHEISHKTTKQRVASMSDTYGDDLVEPVSENLLLAVGLSRGQE